MSQAKTITINGRHYDALSGLAVDAPGEQVELHTPKVSQTHHRATPHATTVHSRTQRSHTLNRKALKKPHHDVVAAPAHNPSPEHTVVLRRKRAAVVTPTATPSINGISKFAPHPVPRATKRVMDVGPVTHPHVAKAHAVSHAKANVPLHNSVNTIQAPREHYVAHKQTAQEVKRSALHEAVANTHVNHNTNPKRKLLKRHPRAMSIVSASFAIVLLGGYLTYLNMPSLSVRVAAAQSGINASYPNYQPDGYSLNGLVGYSEGKVTMKFASNGGPSGFTINQTKSNWDSVAVLDNYVSPRAGASYIPYTERGLTIYTYGNNAAWVNGGILYTIEGDAPLSSEQIRRIATSLI
jgi:hypothetical protein